MSWIINDFRRDLKELKKMYEEAHTIEEKEDILLDIVDVVNCIACFEFDRHKNVVATDDPEEVEELVMNAQGIQGVLLDFFTSAFRYKFYYPLLSSFRSDLRLLDGVDRIEFKHYPDLDITFKDAIGLVDEFYRQTSKEIYRYYSQFDSKNINFREDRSVEQAYIYHSPRVNHSYFDVGMVGDKKRLLHTIAHERGHLIGHAIDSDRINETDFLLEIESIFFELIAEDYFAEQLRDNTFNQYQARKLLVYYQQADKLLKCRDVSLKTFNNMNANKSPFILFDEYAKGQDFSDLDIFKGMRYTISYLVALELQEIYHQDPKEAFDKLKRIVRNSKKTEFERVLNEVMPGESIPKVKKRVLSKVKPDILNVRMKNTDN